MKRRNFALSIAAAAVLGAFNPAYAQISVDPNVGVDANVGISNTDVNASVSSSTTATQSSTDINSSLSAPDAGLSADSSEKHGKARGHDDDKLTGLDRADQVAGEHGAHGRANAREKQGLN